MGQNFRNRLSLEERMWSPAIFKMSKFQIKNSDLNFQFRNFPELDAFNAEFIFSVILDARFVASAFAGDLRVVVQKKAPARCRRRETLITMFWPN